VLLDRADHPPEAEAILHHVVIEQQLDVIADAQRLTGEVSLAPVGLEA